MTTNIRILFVVLLGGICTAWGQALPNLFPLPNASGMLETYNAGGGPIDLTGPFFQSLGTNGRSCSSCHRPAEGWSVSAAEVALRFLVTQGQDPIFRTNDGSVCDHNIDTSTFFGRLEAYRLLIQRGLIRIALAVPNNAEFTVYSVKNRYGCNDTSTLSMYRRPLPAANLAFLSTVMWDGRESSTQTETFPVLNSTNLQSDLKHQALDATMGHAQGAGLSGELQKEIVNFEMALSTAQSFDYRAGALDANGATGGPAALALQTTPAFFIGINDPLGKNPNGTPFTPVIFNLYDAWIGNSHGARASIARGQALFNSKPINITGVAGLNDDLGLASIPGTCGTCHDTPNAGDHSVSMPLNIGVGDLTSPLDVSYLPVIALQNKTTLEIKTTTDPGRALITGLWKDVGKVKGPVLRGLASRAPYFHNGSARSLAEVLEFYDQRFLIGFSSQEKQDLVAFLNTL